MLGEFMGELGACGPSHLVQPPLSRHLHAISITVATLDTGNLRTRRHSTVSVRNL